PLRPTGTQGHDRWWHGASGDGHRSVAPGARLPLVAVRIGAARPRNSVGLPDATRGDLRCGPSRLAWLGGGCLPAVARQGVCPWGAPGGGGGRPVLRLLGPRGGRRVGPGLWVGYTARAVRKRPPRGRD